MRRALVLGSGGGTGVAWSCGVLRGLTDEGLDVAGADRVIGTSGGALVGARLALGDPVDLLTDDLLAAPRAARLEPVALARLLGAQLWPARQQAVRWLGRTARRAASGQAAFVASLGAGLTGRAWPGRLGVVVTALDTGRGMLIDARDGLPLDRAVAASCAVPGVFPPVRLGDGWFFDGGLRSPANADLAAGADRVLVLAPLVGAVRRARRPSVQARGLARALVLAPAGAPGDVFDPRRFRPALAAGREQGRRAAGRVAELWGD